ncbi:MAG: WYL domain-containing protein [candidate division Zixibacteria bacterium]|nr:WYL domain-containing protein [candidate division Zixibacteria bacterium]
MSKQDRLFFILNLLRARRNLNAGKLAAECGVTERSIYRDVVALSEANIPIYYDNGYKLASDNFLPPLNFDFEEYLCVRLAIESSPLNETGKYRRILQKVRAKIEARLSDTVRDRNRFSPLTTHVDIPVSKEQERGEEFYGRIEQAADTCHCLKLKYDSITSGLSERIVEPYFIIFKGRAFYFVAFCRLRNELRTFRLDRILDIELIGDTFVRRNNITPESYFNQSWLVYSGDPVKVVIHFTGAAVRVVQSGIHHPDESIRDLGNGRVEYSVVTRGLEEIQRWILGFGCEADVISPSELRENLAVIGRYLNETYNR